MNKDLLKLIKELEKQGYKVKRDMKTKKHTFEVEEDNLNLFFEAAERHDLKIKEAINEALSDWIKKRS